MNKPLLIWQPDIFPDKEKEIAAKYFTIEDYNQFSNWHNTNGESFSMRGAVNTALRLGFNLEKFNSRFWIPYLSDYLISKNFWWDTAKQTCLKPDWMWPLFIRPDSGRKIFAGQVFTKDKWLEEYAFLKQRNTEKILVFCAEKEYIGREWRCLFVGQELIGISDYMNKGEILGEYCGQREISHELIRLAEEIRLNELFSPEENLTIDIGERKDGSLGLIEINFLESAGWYAVDPELVYKALAKQYE